jgi:hypothetical protein
MLTCLAFGLMMYFNDDRPPNNIVDAIFMAARARIAAHGGRSARRADAPTPPPRARRFLQCPAPD